MAIQNNLKATFYGKAGNYVGMRWKDKTTLRRYVIPKNPRTPLQQDNRSRFKRATEEAQDAMSINKGAPCWDSTRLTEFQMRVSASKRRIDGGATGFTILPLFPDGYTPHTIITDLTLTKGATPQASTLTSEQLRALTTNRNIFIVMQFTDTETQQTVEYRNIVQTEVNSNMLLNGLPPVVDMTKEIYVFAISTDDRIHNNEMVYMAIKQM